MTTPATALEVRLASRPDGLPTLDNFEIAEAPVPTPAPGQVLVRNLIMSVDPYMRGRMRDAKSYVPPFQVGQPLDGGAVGEVVSSTVDSLRPGDVVLHFLGWREYAVVDAATVTKVDPDAAPLGAYLGTLGMPGMTAYAGLTAAAGLREGDVVFVSGAAGAVGSVAGQLAQLLGASRVIGSAGSAEKVRHLVDDLGFDAAFNYKDAPVGEQLAAAAPDGIDVYFDNVGGEHLEAAIDSMNPHGRIAACGMISGYNDPAGAYRPGNLMKIVGWRLRIQGFLVRDHDDLRPEFERRVGGWLREGKLRHEETIVDGIRSAPTAFLDLFTGGNTGKMLVRISS